MSTPISPLETTAKNGDAVPTPLPPCIPPQHPYRTLVVCFDGTGDQCVSPPWLKFNLVLTVLFIFSQVRYRRKPIYISSIVLESNRNVD